MRLEDWQKWLETQFIDPATVEKPAAPAEEAESAPATAEEIADVVVAHQASPVQPAPAFEAPATAPRPVQEAPPPPPAAVAQAAPPPASNGLVDEVDVPSIERYLPFLRGVTAPEPQPEPAVPEPPVAAAVEQHESEAITEPEPLAPTPAPAAPVEPVTIAAERELRTSDAELPAHTTVRRTAQRHRTRPAKHTDPSAIADSLADGGLWDLVPKHIQTLVSMGSEEVAQNSYKREFKESRIELVERILDPTLSLEETARILNVCPTTVRRYTNRGLLTHQRTQGDQRRFKLSDVLAFLESQSQMPSGRT
jgi:excisionase family DNA binding protein